MLRVGVTGGIGSGKTTVCAIFEQLGISVYNADSRTKELYEENETLRRGLISLFGENVYTGNGLDRKRLGEIVFSDASKLKALNALVHPLVLEDYANWCDAHANEKYTIKEAAIMFESGSYKSVDTIVGVVAPEEVRIQRIILREKVDRNFVVQRIQNQMPQEEMASRCDYIIHNDGKQSLIEQVKELHRIFKA